VVELTRWLGNWVAGNGALDWAILTISVFNTILLLWLGLALLLTAERRGPALALAGGGTDGSALIARLLAAAPRVLQPGGFIALEIGYNQAEIVRGLALDTFPTADVRLHQDVEERDRLIWIQTPLHAD